MLFHSFWGQESRSNFRRFGHSFSWGCGQADYRGTIRLKNWLGLEILPSDSLTWLLVEGFTSLLTKLLLAHDLIPIRRVDQVGNVADLHSHPPTEFTFMAVVVILEYFNPSFSVFRPQHSREIKIKKLIASDLNQDFEYIRHSYL